MTPQEANRLEKSIRFAQAFRELDGLGVPKLLTQLDQTGELGRELATLCWQVIADGISQSTGRSETSPDTSIEQIVKLCAVLEPST